MLSKRSATKVRGRWSEPYCFNHTLVARPIASPNGRGSKILPLTKSSCLKQPKHKSLLSLPLAKDSLDGPAVLHWFAQVCAWTDERDLAIEQLQILAKTPAGPDYGDLRLSPSWDPLRGDPRFERIVSSLAPKL
jgi:hypothetical protein